MRLHIPVERNSLHASAERLPERAERIIPFQAESISRWSGICMRYRN